MSISQVKEKLKNNPDLIVQILERLGCHHINAKYKEEIRAALPDGDNDTSIRVKLDDIISCCIFSRSDFDGMDIISLVEYIKHIKFISALQWLCKELNINYEYVPIQECETYKYLKQFRVRKNDIQPHEILDEKILNQFKPIPIQSWIEEGINIDTQRKYEVRFDDKSNRIVFPIRDEFGNLINIKGRTCYKNYKDLGVKKYIHYYPVGIPDYLFGLHYNKPSILKKGEIIIFEAEKSVFKCDSLGIYNVVAAGTHFITDYQIPKLLQLHCNIVIAFDNDVEHKELMKQVDKIKRYTNVYIVQDKVGLLGEKDAPIDKGINIWQQLYDEKVRIV